MENLENLERIKYPIGKFSLKENYSKSELDTFIKEIRGSGKRYSLKVLELSETDLLKTYRPGSWNVKQLLYHVADVQLLYYFRMKKALTESDYHEATLVNMDAWVEKPGLIPLNDSLNLLDGVNQPFMNLASTLTENDMDINYFHPVRKIFFNQKQAIAISAWHLNHHFAHIEIALK